MKNRRHAQINRVKENGKTSARESRLVVRHEKGQMNRLHGEGRQFEIGSHLPANHPRVFPLIQMSLLIWGTGKQVGML